MKMCVASVPATSVKKRLFVTIACGTLSALSVGAYADAAYPGTITITAPRSQTVGRDNAIHAPIVQFTAQARVPFVPVTLTTHSGVALLQDRVATAARELCADLDPFSGGDQSCVRQALQDAQPQIDAAINRARANSEG